MYSPLGFIKNSYNPVRSKVVIGCTIILAVVSFSGVYLVARSGSRADTSGLSTIVDDNFNYIDLPDVVDAKPVNGRLPGVKNLFSLESTIPVKDRITTTSFMFRGDFSSPIHDLFVLHKRALKICDKDTKADGCDIKLANNYTWFTLGAKLLDTLEILCKVDDDKKTDFYIKYDDDLLMSETKLEEIIRKMASTRCQFAGGIALDFPYYWAVGQIYIFKRSIFDTACRNLPTFAREGLHSEDILMGRLINSTNTNAFCSLESPKNHWHASYNDQRVEIKYHIQHNE
ncbi:hypothetical protein GGI02_000898 [Coemansia sp. RSA 2322]|uniref:Uncharacterized protein n=1 Tax=Coemansia thaxteri TaxID=2663907 RepID=A0A9W8BGI9_9FUNG|nr:hypothetical protein H4R26_002438 [Coemansia thaxteri]KAJ2473384.1 hypothetical protein GGI02_000898 [Coemansia sp. RSA 2322]